MRREIREHVKKCVYEYIAPIHFGKVSLSEVFRLFSDYGSPADLEKCLDSFVKDGIAEKTRGPEGKSYVFSDLALEFGKRWTAELKYLQFQAEGLKQESYCLRRYLQVMEEVRDIWLSDWNEAYEDERAYACLKNYISSVFWGNRLRLRLESLQQNDSKLREVENRIINIRKKIESSYEGIAK